MHWSNVLVLNRAQVFGEDNYYKPREHYGVDAPGWTDEEMEKRIDFDDPASKEMDSVGISSGGAEKQRNPFRSQSMIFRCTTGIWAKQNIISPSEFIIVEGVHVLHEKRYFSLFDLTVFVDTPSDLRLARRIKRDVTERVDAT